MGSPARGARPFPHPGSGPVGYSTRRVRHPEGLDKGHLDWHTQPQADPYAFWWWQVGNFRSSSPPSPASPQLEDYSCSKGPPVTAKRMKWESIRTWPWAWVQGAEPCLGPGSPARGCRGRPHPMGGNDLKSLDPVHGQDRGYSFGGENGWPQRRVNVPLQKKGGWEGGRAHA